MVFDRLPLTALDVQSQKRHKNQGSVNEFRKTVPGGSPVTEKWVTVIPVYSESFQGREEARLRFSAPFLGANVVLVAPENLDVSAYSSVLGLARVEYFDKRWFESQSAYSNFMLSASIYERFRSFDVMMVYQLDAIVQREVPRLALGSFDYVGAPWTPPFELRWNPFRGQLLAGKGFGFRRQITVGNGGLSLRRISVFRRASRLLPKINNHINEDLVFSYFAPALRIRLPGIDHARSVFMETEASDWEPGRPVPDVVGFHALGKHNAELENAVLCGYPLG